jgi:hypothetical protein
LSATSELAGHQSCPLPGISYRSANMLSFRLSDEEERKDYQTPK